MVVAFLFLCCMESPAWHKFELLKFPQKEIPGTKRLASDYFSPVRFKLHLGSFNSPGITDFLPATLISYPQTSWVVHGSLIGPWQLVLVSITRNHTATFWELHEVETRPYHGLHTSAQPNETAVCEVVLTCCWLGILSIGAFIATIAMNTNTAKRNAATIYTPFTLILSVLFTFLLSFSSFISSVIRKQWKWCITATK